MLNAETESVVLCYLNRDYSVPGWEWSCKMSFGRDGVQILVGINKSEQITMDDWSFGNVKLTWDEIEYSRHEPHMTVWYKVKPLVAQIYDAARQQS